MVTWFLASTIAPTDSYLLRHKPLCSSFPHWIGLTCVTSRVLQKWWSMISEGRWWKSHCFLCPELFWISCFGGSHPQYLQDIEAALSMEGSEWLGTKASCQQPTLTCQTCERTTCVDPAAGRVLRWLQPWQTLECNLSCSQIPDPQILRKIISVHCFKELNFGIICYVVIDN